MKIPEHLPVERISVQSLWKALMASLNLEKGYFFTLKELLIRPGKALRAFLFTEERLKYVKPLSFLLLSLAISIFFAFKALEWHGGLDLNNLNNNQGVDLSPELQAALSKLMEVIFKYQNLFEILKVPFISFFTFKFFERAQFNFAEHLVVNAYALGVQSILSIFIILIVLNLNPGFSFILVPLIFIYYVFVHVKVFQEPQWWKGILKSMAAWIIAYMIHSLVLMIILYSYFLWIDPDTQVRKLVAPFF